MGSVDENLQTLQEKIESACLRAGRDPREVQLVAVSKTRGPEVIAEALEAGQMIFGENRVQEAEPKIEALPGRCRWHLVGHLQSNKARRAVRLFEMIHSVDSLKLAETIARLCEEEGARPQVLIQVSVSGEASKFGIQPEALCESIEAFLELQPLEIVGLMTVPPLGKTAEESRRYFAALRELRERLEQKAGIGLPELSMGMSNDFEIGIEEGATLVRVGSAIFGERK